MDDDSVDGVICAPCASSSAENEGGSDPTLNKAAEGSVQSPTHPSKGVDTGSSVKNMECPCVRPVQPTSLKLKDQDQDHPHLDQLPPDHLPRTRQGCVSDSLTLIRNRYGQIGQWDSKGN